MAFFDQVYQQLFGQKSEKPKVLVHELIKRSDSAKENYLKHINSKTFLQSIQAIYRSYQLKMEGVDNEPKVHLLKSQYANGFAVSLEKNDKKNAEILFDWFAEKIAGLDYQKTNSDRIITNRPTYVETKEKHYLKPNVGNDDILNQQFGNILVEYICIDNHPNHIKVTANVYNDRKYSIAKDFDKLIEYLFSE
tara:strand:- start:248 stop:826 length:579 start_codon:yes stop_codon:yes gene_type:complete